MLWLLVFFLFGVGLDGGEGADRLFCHVSKNERTLICIYAGQIVWLTFDTPNNNMGV